VKQPLRIWPGVRRGVLKSGAYYLLFAANDGAAEATNVAAECYLKYD
jgi:hypothetical protein